MHKAETRCVKHSTSWDAGLHAFSVPPACNCISEAIISFDKYLHLPRDVASHCIIRHDSLLLCQSFQYNKLRQIEKRTKKMFAGTWNCRFCIYAGLRADFRCYEVRMKSTATRNYSHARNHQSTDIFGKANFNTKACTRLVQTPPIRCASQCRNCYEQSDNGVCLSFECDKT